VSHPPAPWHLGGPAVIVPGLVPLARAREFIPPEVGIVPALPGYTLGGLIAVSYEPGGTLSYNELIAWAGIARVGARAGIWVSHIWVDDEESVSGGRQIWKLPKDLAQFETHRSRGRQWFTARLGDVTLARLAISRPRFTLSQPGLSPMVSGMTGSVWYTLGRGQMDAGWARARVEIPANSPISRLDMRPAPVALAGRSKLVMDAARQV
jgi:acetoacetate decarboxylase